MNQRPGKNILTNSGCYQLRQMMLIISVLVYLIIALSITILSARDDYSSSAGNPMIQFKFVPPYSSTLNLEGQVQNVNPDSFKVAVYIFVEGAAWWTKPTFAQPLTPIRPDCTWTTDITTGGSDIYATRICAFLVPNGSDPPLSGGLACLPVSLYTMSVAQVCTTRNPRIISFSGYEWWVKASVGKVGPGPNFFSDDIENVWVDGDDNLHLKITKRNGNWYCPEVILNNSFGYGRYVFQVTGQIGQFNENVVLGLFTWDNDACTEYFREIDIEFSRFGNAQDIANAQYVIQPWNRPGNRQRWYMPISMDSSTHSFDWSSDGINFLSVKGHQSTQPYDSVIYSWTYTRANVPTPETETTRINLWLFNSEPPSDGAEVEVIISKFEYLPPTNEVTQTIPISHGRLNMISFNILPPDLAVDVLLNDLESLLIAQDDDGNFYIPPYSVNTIGDVDLTNGYQVYITGSADDNVVNEGDPLVPQDYSQALNNTKLFMICYPYQNPHPVVDVFALITSSVVVVQDDEGHFWIPMYGVNTMGDMQPGKGYQIYVNQTVNFTYPALSGGLARATKPVVKLPEPNHFQFQCTGVPYGIVVAGSEEALAVGDEVGVFSGGLCVGASVFTGDYPLVIAAWEGHEEYGLTGFKAGETISFRVWKACESKEVEVAGRFATLAESTFRGGPISVVQLGAFVPLVAIPTTFALNQNYPNPFNPETVIEFQLPKNSHVSLRIYNLMGQEIRTLVDEQKKAGYHQVSWDGKDASGEEVSSGMYLYIIEAGDFRMTRKMVRMR